MGMEALTRSWAFQLSAAVVVQLLMLTQAGLTYLLLRWRYRPGTNAAKAAVPRGLIPLDSAVIATNPLLSIIVPAFNEAKTIESTLRRVREAASRPQDLEIIVVDARGSDGTMEVAARVAASLNREEEEEEEETSMQKTKDNSSGNIKLSGSMKRRHQTGRKSSNSADPGKFGARGRRPMVRLDVALPEGSFGRGPTLSAVGDRSTLRGNCLSHFII